MTNIKNMFSKDISRPINGVVKAEQNDKDTVSQELDEYVVTNELERHFRAFFEAYSTDVNDPSIAGKVGVWISGFFGSGKSHFLKILSYVLANQIAEDSSGNKKEAVHFFDKEKIRDAMIRADITKAVSNPSDVILFNIDTKANSIDDGNAILDVFLRVFNEHMGFSGDHPHIAHMERYLVQKKSYDTFKNSFKEISGSEWADERDGFHFYQDEIEKSLSQTLSLSPEAAHKWFEESEDNFSVSVDNFCHWVKDYLEEKESNHRVIFLVDEVGQFIGSDTKRMLTLQTITENLGTVCKGQAWIIVTSQADMDAVLGELSSSKANDFSKIAGRFKTRLSLSSSNTDEVIQRRLLKKTPEADAELRALFEKKGDIIKNQIMFDSTGPTLKNYDGPESFANNYPFAPYHFQLVQKVFEEIRKVGATGTHLAYGERSMLDSFQLAAIETSDKPIGTLVPMHQFYSSIEGFLDNTVKRTIDQAKENNVLDHFDSKMLRTLFMIRYVDMVKGTLDNLVTLSIEGIDQDKLVLRKQIEKSLQRLEKESLITRNGDEFLFLTNEERDITQKIKATDIASNEENKALSDLIFKEVLNDKNKFRYGLNKVDYTIGRYLDGHTLDGRYEADLSVEILSPLDVDYNTYSESHCINKSAEGKGSVLIKLQDDRQFFVELGTWLRTNKYIRVNSDDSQPDTSRILAERGRENQERKKRLRIQVEEMLSGIDVYCLGEHPDINSSSVALMFDEACKYLLENTYTKLSYLKVLQNDPWRELKAVLTVDDVGQLGLSLDGEEGNPLAIKEMEQYINLRTTGNDRILVSDVVERFSKRPFGWPDAEVLLVLGYLAANSRITFQLNTDTLLVKDAFEPLQNSRKRREVSIIRKRQTDDVILKQARNLTQDLFSVMGPSTEKELFEFYLQNFKSWLSHLKSYKSKTEVGRFPGKSEINSSLLSLERLLANEDSFDFFKNVVENKNEYLDLEENYRDIHEFFTNQIGTWQQLQHALVKFDKNKQALERDEKSKNSLEELRTIELSDSPYANLHKITGLVVKVTDVNDALLKEKREHAIQRVEAKINQLQGEIDNSGIATPDLSNQLLRPLQLVKANIETETSIPQIYMLQTQTADENLDDGLEMLVQTISTEAKKSAETTKGLKSKRPDADDSQAVKTIVTPKAIVDISISSVLSSVNQGVYIESQQDINKFIATLTQKLESAITDEKRIRIKL